MNTDVLKSPAIGYLPELDFTQCLGNVFYRHPAWRWQAALRRAAGGLKIRRPAQHFDQHVHVAARFLRKLAASGDVSTSNLLWAAWPGLCDALKISLSSGWPRAELEAWLLTGEPLERIAERTQLNLVTVSSYERYFYDVADRAPGRILGSIINIHHESHSAEPYTHRAVKALAYTCGRQMLESLLTLDIPNMKRLTLRDCELHLNNPADDHQRNRCLLALRVLSFETIEEQLELLKFASRLWSHPLYRDDSAASPVVDVSCPKAAARPVDEFQAAVSA